MAMMCIPIVSENNRIRLLIILEQGNIDRILSHDPCDVFFHGFPPDFRDLPVEHIAICYATLEEMDKIDVLAHRDDLAEIIRIITRGFTIQQSDLKRGMPYKIIKPTDKEPS